MKTYIYVGPDETGTGQFKVKVDYYEGDTREKNGQSAQVVVYIDSDGQSLQSLPTSIPEISKKGLAAARRFLQRILDEAK